MACDELIESEYLRKFARRKRNRYQLVGAPETQEVYFKMIDRKHLNATLLSNELDAIVQKPRKFICINDNLNVLGHGEIPAPGGESESEFRRKRAAEWEQFKRSKGLLRQFYVRLLPNPSSFELSTPESLNKYLYYDEYKLHKVSPTRRAVSRGCVIRLGPARASSFKSPKKPFHLLNFLCFAFFYLHPPPPQEAEERLQNSITLLLMVIIFSVFLTLISVNLPPPASPSPSIAISIWHGLFVQHRHTPTPPEGGWVGLT